MGEPFKDRAAVAAKVEWEGGVMDALDYGIHAVDMPVGDKELIAAWTALENVRDGYQELCREFSPSAQSGMSARVSLTVLNRHRVKARLPLLATTVIAATREDITLRYRRERDEAREQAEQMELERNEARQLLANHKRAAARVHEELSAQLAEVRRIACQCGKDAVFVWRELLAYLEGING